MTDALIPVIGAFESTYQPQHDVDIVESTEHAVRWRADLELMLECGVRTLRYPIRWHRIEPEPGEYRWRYTDEVLSWMRDHGVRPIADLCHHMSHPRWLTGGFADERFGPAFLRFCEAFANRYPWIPGYTIFNEPFTTLFLAGSEGLFPPYLRGMDGFLRLARSLLPAISGASRMLAALLPDAQHLNVDTCERHSASAATGEAYADYANDRRFFVTDLLMGAHIDERRPFVEALLASGGADILECEAARIDVLGLDYYAHSQWQFSGDGIGAGSSPQPGRLDDLIVEYWERYQLPCMLGETNLRGKPSDRATWLKYTLEHCENAVRRGVPLTGYCWFPFVDSCDWVSLLRHADRQIDPVGVYWLDGTFERMPSSMSRSYVLAVAHGSEVLPAYRLHPPVADWLAGYLPQMQHWEWLDAPAEQPASNEPRPDEHIVLPAPLEEPPPGPAYQP